MKRRMFLTQIVLSTTIPAVIFSSCSSTNDIITIDVDPDYFKTNYAGLQNGVNYFTYSLEGTTIYLKPNPAKNLYITANQRYSGLDSLRIKKTRIEMGSDPVYTIEEIVKEK